MIAAVITAYKPDAGFAARFSPLLSVCGSIIVSDNTPGGHDEFQVSGGVTIIHNRQNIGLGPALNVGIDEARRQGARHLILFDQDSTPTAELVNDMLARLEAAIALNGPRCCVGPTHVDDRAQQGANATGTAIRAAFAGTPWQQVSCLPTSGMILRVDALTSADRFTEDFFLDLVDFEWCWRLGSVGWRFLRAPDIRMSHRLGEVERKFLGITFYVPAPYRHYFQVRDTLRLSFRPCVPSYSKLRLIGVLPLKALVYPFILDCGPERLKWMLRGVIDSVCGVRGIGAAGVQLSHELNGSWEIR